MKISKLFDKSGGQIANPKQMPGSISYEEKVPVAHAWGEDGRTLLAEMHSARVISIGPSGMRIEGMEPIEPIDASNTRFRAMAWYVSF